MENDKPLKSERLILLETVEQLGYCIIKFKGKTVKVFDEVTRTLDDQSVLCLEIVRNDSKGKSPAGKQD